MTMANSYYIIFISLALVALTAISETSCRLTDPVIQCQQLEVEIQSDEGLISISRINQTCGFKAKSNNQFFVIQTDDLKLKAEDEIRVFSDNSKDADVTIIGPQEDGYIVSGGLNTKLVFAFKGTDDTNMLVRFYQKSFPIVADRNKAIKIKNINVKNNYTVKIQKQIDGPVYIQENHLLIDSDEAQVDLTNQSLVRLTISPVLKSCSGSHESKTEETVDISGPASDALKDVDSYKCVNVFTNTMVGKAHYDVGFQNFIDLVDQMDTLTVTDGKNTLDITQSNSQQYKELKTNISFSGPKLVAVYDSPVKEKRLGIQFKLAVHSRSIGGIVDSYGYKFDLPTNGSAYYSLKLPTEKRENVALQLSELAGVDLTITNHQNKVIKLQGPNFPKFVVFDDADINIEVARTSGKVSGSISYQRGDCGGTLFEPSGTISVSGSNKTCYWLLGSQSNRLAINSKDLRSDGALEIFNSVSVKPILDKKNIGPSEVLPPINIDGPVYLVIHLGSTKSAALEASISKKDGQSVSYQAGSQSILTSTNYPVTYAWSSESETLSIDAKNKEMVLTVADLDLREGEKMSFNSTNVAKVPLDFDLKNQTAEFKIQRTGSNDLKMYRGYKIVTTEFQTISLADMTKSSLTTPKNLTSYLLRIPGSQGKRILYNITSSSKDTNFVMQVIDSASIMGRQAQADAKLNGSSTSNVLLISFRSLKDKAFLPTFTINYSQVACNRTTDQTCDNSTRCVPADMMCKGVGYCDDGKDLKVRCSSGPAPAPKVIESGVSGAAVFFVSLLMFAIGAITALYGPDLYKNLEYRFRSGHYTTFQSAE